MQGGNDWEDDEDEQQDAAGPPQPLVAGLVPVPVGVGVQMQDDDAELDEPEEGDGDEVGVPYGWIMGAGGPQGSQGGQPPGALASEAEGLGAAGVLRAEGDEPMPMAFIVRE